MIPNPRRTIGEAAVDTARAIPGIVNDGDLIVDLRSDQTARISVRGGSVDLAAQLLLDSMVEPSVKSDLRARATDGQDLSGNKVKVTELDGQIAAVRVDVDRQEPPHVE